MVRNDASLWRTLSIDRTPINASFFAGEGVVSGQCKSAVQRFTAPRRRRHSGLQNLQPVVVLGTFGTVAYQLADEDGDGAFGTGSFQGAAVNRLNWASIN